MVLKGLELQGFKSFPDKTTLSFSQGFTAVVGPNGSGKSNISDAIRWVLGEQSSKSLRGAKMEDVVFGGTAKRKSLGFAEVSLIIDNTTNLLEFDCDDVKVTRRYYRSGESEYLLNNATVRLKDVQLLFMDTGLGRDGYSIIGQGRVADIVSSKSAERREIFEEAAGIARYRYQKNESERRLNAAEENLLRLRDILVELEERVGPLKIQSEKARKFLELDRVKRELEIGIWVNSLSLSKEKIRDLTSKLELARTQYDGSDKAIDDVEKEVNAIMEEGHRLSAMMDLVREKSSLLEEEAIKKESEVAVLNNDIFHNSENMKRLSEDAARSDSSDKEFDEEIGIRSALIKQKKNDIEKEQSLATELAVDMKNLSDSSELASDEINKITQKTSTLALTISDLRVKMVSGESSLAEVTRRLSQLTATRAQQTIQKELIIAAHSTCSKSLATCKDNIDELTNTFRGYEMRYASRLEVFETAKTSADKAHLDAEGIRRRAKILSDLERNMDGFNKSVKTVMQQSDRKAIRGIHGPVSQLIETLPETALAIETALGAGAQSIVCENEQVAKQVIKYLRETKGGRVTLLPLSSIKGRAIEERGLEDEPGFVGIASKLVTFSAKYKDIVENALGRVVVAQTLDDAVIIARSYSYRFRVVTLDGQVVNAGGSLTGGSSVRGAGLLSRRAEIERLEKEALALLEQATVALEKVKISKEEVSAAEAALVGCRGELVTAQENAIRFDAELRRLFEQKENFEKFVSDAGAEISELGRRAAQYEHQIASSSQKTIEVQKEQDIVSAEAELLLGGRQELSSKREVLSIKISDCKLRILEMQKEVEAQHTTIQETVIRKKHAAMRAEEIQVEIEKINSHNGTLSLAIEKLHLEAEQKREAGKSALSEIDSYIEKRSAGEKKQSELRQLSRDKSSEREKIGQDVVRLEEQVLTLDKERDEIIRKLYDEYELTRIEAEGIAAPIENLAHSKKELNSLKNSMRNLGHVNVDAIEEYKEVSQRYEFLSVQVADVDVSRKELLKLIGDLTSQMRDIFLERFELINYNYGIMFTELFGGGKASLTLSDPNDILNSGIEMNVQPPGKVILNMDSLSGGEKALVAIALFFAILKVNPSPFCVLDEIEAALDDVNVDRFASFIKRSSVKTQFIVITHRRGTMEHADVLYGVTMQEQGVSKLLELRASEIEEQLGISIN